MECETLRKELNKAQDRLQFFEGAIAKEHHEIEQVLGKALGYPQMFPEVSDVDDGTVCVGDHGPVTLAEEAARKLSAYRAKERPVDPVAKQIIEAKF